MSLQTFASRTASALGRDSTIVNWLRPGYERGLALMTMGRGIRWSINGIPCRIDAQQRHRMARSYDSPVAEWLSQHVEPGDLCANVGGNLGVYVLQCAYWNGPEGRVVVFEPNPGARKILERHIRYNHLAARVQLVGAAVTDTIGTATFFADATGDGMSRLGAPNELLATTIPIEVPTIDLNTFFTVPPAWLIIDVEGFELKVLRGASRLLAQCKGIVVELHPGAWSVAGTSAADLEAFLADHSLKLTPLSGQADPFREYGHVLLQPPK